MNATTTTRRPKALLLDDDPVVLHRLATTLEARGFDVRAAHDGESGLELLLDELLELDVLVADADLPGRDGVSLVHLVRNAGGERDLAVVVLASGASRGLRQQLLSLGADAVVDPAVGQDGVADVVTAIATPLAAQPAARRAEPTAPSWLRQRAGILGELAVPAARAAWRPTPRLAGATAGTDAFVLL
jgi:CheY-like chemotaxis protein